MMDEVSLDIERMKHRNYEQLDGMIKGSMKRSAAEVVRLGFLLRQMMDEGLYSVYYLCFDAYLEEELHMDYTAANRFIGINKKYSVGGKSDTIDEKYAEYSQGLLIEMLSMPPELEKQITPDMTVRQAREIKREAKQKDIKHKPDVYGLMSRPYCSACDTSLDDDQQPARCPKCGQLQDWDWYNRTYWPQEQEAPDESKVIEGEYREVNVSEPDQKEEEQSTGLSAYGLPKTEYPEGSLLTTKGCGHKYDCFLCAQECSIRQEERMCQEASLGNPYGCKTVDILDNVRADRGDKCQFINTELAYKSAGGGSPVPCCKECHEISECAYACDSAKKKAPGPEEDEFRADIATSQQFMEEKSGSGDGEQEPADGLGRIRHILEQEQKLLHDYLGLYKLGEIPEPTMYRQKIIVGALANMLCGLELEDIKREKEPAAKTQQEFPELKNNDQRKQWLSEYKSWGLWYRDENIDVNYYKFDLPDGSRLIAAEYPQRHVYWKDERKDEHYFHLLEKNKMGYEKKYDEQYRQQTDSVTYLVDFLKNIQKKAGEGEES